MRQGLRSEPKEADDVVLERINSPQELKRLTIEELQLLAAELRQRIIEVVSSTGGHLASSLGAVELTIALHYCLNTPEDKIVWDVGHQAYAHKILTGRNKAFATLRQYQGISGFPFRGESEYDALNSGHSSTAVSAALGIACARDFQGQRQRCKVVAVIGDGSLSGGLCFEGLNNAGHLKNDLLVILNTNELSIAPNAGALSTYLNKLISLPIYNRFKESLEVLIRQRLPKGSRILKIANKFEEGLKGLFIPGMLFEELGFRYFGPLDGHNLLKLIPTLKNILTIRGPIILHVVTKKGKGYPPAEKDPVRFHGVGPFDIASGLTISQNKPPEERTYTEVFSRCLKALASEQKNIVAITAAMPEGTGLDAFRDAYPDRFFDVGIAEGHAVCFAGGLARMGLKPVIAVYSTFLQRAYDQIIEDVALQGLGVVLAIDRAGIVGEDGMTHQGVFDIAFLRSIPNMVVAAPKDAAEFEALLRLACQTEAPFAIRYPKAVCPRGEGACGELRVGKAEVLSKKGEDFCLVALGSMVAASQEAAQILAKDGLFGIVINARFVKPLDSALLESACAKVKRVFTVEEAVVDGGFGSAVSELLGRPVTCIGLPCAFIPHGKRHLLLDKYGLSASAIAQKVKETLWAK